MKSEKYFAHTRLFSMELYPSNAITSTFLASSPATICFSLSSLLSSLMLLWSFTMTVVIGSLVSGHYSIFRITVITSLAPNLLSFMCNNPDLPRLAYSGSLVRPVMKVSLHLLLTRTCPSRALPGVPGAEPRRRLAIVCDY